MKTKWLDRDTVRAPHLALCLSEKAFDAAARHCKVDNPGPWLAPGLVACVHSWEMPGKLVAVVCLHPDSERADPIEVACTLVHEAVHVCQRLCDNIGEHQPGREFEAYTIERIAERLMREFVRQVKP